MPVGSRLGRAAPSVWGLGFFPQAGTPRGRAESAPHRNKPGLVTDVPVKVRGLLPNPLQMVSPCPPPPCSSPGCRRPECSPLLLVGGKHFCPVSLFDPSKLGVKARGEGHRIRAPAPSRAGWSSGRPLGSAGERRAQGTPFCPW